MIMENKSQENSEKELRKRIKDLDAALDSKALEADLYRIMVEKASGEYGTDLVKKF